MNTRITYAGSNLDYNDNLATSVLAGELSPAQVRRLALGSTFGKLDPVCDELGLAHLRNNGTGVSLVAENSVPTLEPATNPRTDAARFYARVIPLFAAQSMRGSAAAADFAEGEKRIAERLRGKRLGEFLSTKRALLAMEPDQVFVAGCLRSMSIGPVMAASILSPLDFELPPAGTARTIDPDWKINHAQVLYLFPVAWHAVRGNDEAGANLLNAMTPNTQISLAQAQAAVATARTFLDTVIAWVARTNA